MTKSFIFHSWKLLLYVRTSRGAPMKDESDEICWRRRGILLGGVVNFMASAKDVDDGGWKKWKAFSSIKSIITIWNCVPDGTTLSMRFLQPCHQYLIRISHHDGGWGSEDESSPLMMMPCHPPRRAANLLIIYLSSIYRKKTKTFFGVGEFLQLLAHAGRDVSPLTTKWRHLLKTP